MRRRWIVAGLVLLALVVAAVVFAPRREPSPFPDDCWYCATNHEVRRTPHGDTCSEFFMIAEPATAERHARGIIYLNLSFPRMLIARIFGPRDAVTGRLIYGTGTVESADGCSWERFELKSPTAAARPR
jgi:hypothetical protein